MSECMDTVISYRIKVQDRTAQEINTCTVCRKCTVRIAYRVARSTTTAALAAAPKRIFDTREARLILCAGVLLARIALGVRVRDRLLLLLLARLAFALVVRGACVVLLALLGGHLANAHVHATQMRERDGFWLVRLLVLFDLDVTLDGFADLQLQMYE